MTPRFLLPAAALAAMSIVSASPSFALSAKECSALYQTAKTQGKLNGMTWNEYRKKECAGVYTDETESKATKAEVKKEEKKAAKVEEKPVVKPAAVVTGVVFPKLIDPKYAKESAGKARMHTCRDQYYANKPTNGNGGHKWIEKGGGYYSLCNAALKH